MYELIYVDGFKLVFALMVFVIIVFFLLLFIVATYNYVVSDVVLLSFLFIFSELENSNDELIIRVTIIFVDSTRIQDF